MSNDASFTPMTIETGNSCCSGLCSSGKLEWTLARSVQQALDKLPPMIRQQYMLIMEDSMHTLTAVLGSSAGLRPDRALEMFGSIIAHLKNLSAQMDQFAEQSESLPPGYGRPVDN